MLTLQFIYGRICYALHIWFALLNAHSSINLNVLEPWCSVDGMDSIAFAKIEVIAVSNMKHDISKWYYPFIDWLSKSGF